MSTTPNSLPLFKLKPRYLNFRREELENNFDPYQYGATQYTMDGVQINPAISKMAVSELNTDTPTRTQRGSRVYGNAGFNQFSMKPLETRNNNEFSVNEVFKKEMNRTTAVTPSFFVQPLSSRYQILSPKPDEFKIKWNQPGNGDNNFDLV